MAADLSRKEKMQEEDIELMNCVHMRVTRLIHCVPIIVPTHVETVCLLQKVQNGSRKLKVRKQTLEDTGISEVVLNEIRSLALKYKLNKVVLFGSRARGDFKRTSDIDLAVSGGDIAGFSSAVDEETSTLLEYDVVNMDKTVQDELRKIIQDEGRILYEEV